MAPVDEPDADLARRVAAAGFAGQVLAALEEGAITVSDASQSMAPLLIGGEQLRWRRSAGTPRRGDLVVFAQGAGLTVHRVLGRPRGGRLPTKGDHRPNPDEPQVAAVDVIGVVAEFRRDDTIVSLTTAGARVYATLAWTCSALGALLHRAAAAGDRVLGRLAPPLRDRWLLRAPAWWLQRAGQRVLHALLFRACHSRREAS